MRTDRVGSAELLRDLAGETGRNALLGHHAGQLVQLPSRVGLELGLLTGQHGPLRITLTGDRDVLADRHRQGAGGDTGDA